MLLLIYRFFRICEVDREPSYDTQAVQADGSLPVLCDACHIRIRDRECGDPLVSGPVIYGFSLCGHRLDRYDAVGMAGRDPRGPRRIGLLFLGGWFPETVPDLRSGESSFAPLNVSDPAFGQGTDP